MEHFETRSVVNRNTFKELRWHVRKPRDNATIILCLLAIFIAIVWANVTQEGVFASIGVAGIAIVIFLLRINGPLNTMWKRQKESTGAEGIEQVVTFLEDKIQVHNPQTSAMIYLKYDLIQRFAETQSMYALFTKENQCIVVDKVSLIQEKKSEAFIRFLKDKCKNVKWKR